MDGWMEAGGINPTGSVSSENSNTLANKPKLTYTDTKDNNTAHVSTMNSAQTKS